MNAGRIRTGRSSPSATATAFSPFLIAPRWIPTASGEAAKDEARPRARISTSTRSRRPAGRPERGPRSITTTHHRERRLVGGRRHPRQEEDFAGDRRRGEFQRQRTTIPTDGPVDCGWRSQPHRGDARHLHRSACAASVSRSSTTSRSCRTSAMSLPVSSACASAKKRLYAHDRSPARRALRVWPTRARPSGTSRSLLPRQAVRLIVGTAPGGGYDLFPASSPATSPRIFPAADGYRAESAAAGGLHDQSLYALGS